MGRALTAAHDPGENCKNTTVACKGARGQGLMWVTLVVGERLVELRTYVYVHVIAGVTVNNREIRLARDSRVPHGGDGHDVTLPALWTVFIIGTIQPRVVRLGCPCSSVLFFCLVIYLIVSSLVTFEGGWIARS